MAVDKLYGTKLPKWVDRDEGAGKKFDTATYMGIIKDNKDPIKGGRLRVWIPDLGGAENDDSFWQTVAYASPFFGATFVGDTIKNNKFDTTNHTYGMWMVPPDLGNQVLCTFVNGDPDRGYWFACINPTLSHYMVPAIAAGNKLDKASASAMIAGSIEGDGQYLPVAEFNENNDAAYSSGFYNNPKPVHEWQANILLQQGLDTDPIRGAVTSNSQRESPSHVFGISTPGRAYGNDPAEDPEYGDKLSGGNLTEKMYEVRTRKGGHTFVMDDGDVNGKDQLFRIRSAGGHEILMNDTENTMYVVNSKGSCWFELNPDGSMNVYNAGSFSLRSEGDLNLHSDANVNIQAGSSINFNATTSLTATSADIKISAVNTTLLYGGSKIDVGTGSAMTLGAQTIKIGAGGAIDIAGSTVDINSSAGGNDTTGVTLQQTQFNDASYDSTSRRWSTKPQQVSSIVTTLPTHEPFPRVPPGPVPEKTLPSKTCGPASGVAPSSYVLPAPNKNKLDNGKVWGQPAGWTTDTAFLDKVKEIAGKLNANYMDMLAFMYNESAGTMDPGIVNSIGATGLIQFMPQTATGLGTTTAALAKLTRVEQMDWVLKFYNYFKFTKKVPNPKLQDLYLCVFWPASVGQADNYVIAPAGSKVAEANKGLRGPDGSITCASVGAVAAGKLAIVKQALANAGATTPAQAGTLQSGSGVAVTDGSGKPINTGSTSSNIADAGPAQAAGKSVANACPVEYMTRKDAYTPTAEIGSGSIAFTITQVKALHAELGYFESAWSYEKADATYIGKYQIDSTYLTNAGYLKPDALKQYGDIAFTKGEAWTNKGKIGSQADFTKAGPIQEYIQNIEFKDYFVALSDNGGIKSGDDLCTAAGMLFVAHMYRDPEIAKQWRLKGLVNDPPKIMGKAGTPEDYFNHGRSAIDVLAVNTQAAIAEATGTPPNGSNDSGIDPASVMNFSSGYGSLDAFKKTTSTFQSAMTKAAQAYYKATGKKIMVNSAYRPEEYQQKLYDRWVTAGGKMPNPPGPNPVAGLNQPSKPNGKPDSHGGGIAIDTSQATDMKNTINLADFGLRWGGEFGDQVHIQIKAWGPGQKFPP
jgi:hypothetical protein